jgi:hypothetical protein
MDRYSLKKLNGVEGKVKYCVEFSNRFAALEDLDAEVELVVPGPSHLEVEIAIAEMKKLKSPGSDNILAELIQAGGETLVSVTTNRLIPFGIRKNCLISGRSLLLYQFTRRARNPTVIIIMGYHCYQLHTKFYQISFFHG